MWFRPSPVIEFFCLTDEDYPAIARPVPAKKMLPDWYRELPKIDPATMSAGRSGQTVKVCMPFLDAMAEGWILTAPADLMIELSNNGSNVEAGSNYPQQIASMHYNDQLKGHPDAHKAIIRLHTLWCVRTSPGTSCLLVPPLNRGSADFQVFSGIIDTDTFHQQIVMPAHFTRPDGVFAIPKGTPVVQVIPFRREAFRAVTRPPKKGEGNNNTQQRTVLGEKGWYRKHLRAKR